MFDEHNQPGEKQGYRRVSVDSKVIFPHLPYHPLLLVSQGPMEFSRGLAETNTVQTTDRPGCYLLVYSSRSPSLLTFICHSRDAIYIGTVFHQLGTGALKDGFAMTGTISSVLKPHGCMVYWCESDAGLSIRHAVNVVAALTVQTRTRLCYTIYQSKGEFRCGTYIQYNYSKMHIM